MELEQILPGDIERRSFEIITEELGDTKLDPVNAAIIKRVIHTTADFEYVQNLVFSQAAVPLALKALREGAPIVTDTNMGKAGINKRALKKSGSEVYCFMSDEDVACEALKRGTTRAWASMDKAAGLGRDCIFAIGNAPTALIRLYDLVKEGRIKPRLIIAVPVGFVNVVQAKELILSLDVPYIVARGRKGGSNVAAAVCNGLLYQLDDEHLFMPPNGRQTFKENLHAPGSGCTTTHESLVGALGIPEFMPPNGRRTFKEKEWI